MTQYRNKVMLVGLSISKYDGYKRDKQATDEITKINEVKQGAARVNKSLFPKDATHNINVAATNARLVFYKYTMPWSDEGYRILVVELYNDFIAEIALCKRKFEEAVADFIKNYNLHIEQAKRMLGKLWNPYEYPKREDIINRFAFNVKVMPLPDAKDFRVDIADEEIKIIQKDIEQRVSSAMQEAINEPIMKLHAVIKHLADRLSDPEARFHYTLLDNLRELVELMPKFNFTNDPKINTLVNEAKALLVYNADTLRSDPAARSTTAQAAQKLSQTLESWF